MFEKQITRDLTTMTKFPYCRIYWESLTSRSSNQRSYIRAQGTFTPPCSQPPPDSLFRYCCLHPRWFRGEDHESRVTLRSGCSSTLVNHRWWLTVLDPTISMSATELDHIQPTNLRLPSYSLSPVSSLLALTHPSHSTPPATVDVHRGVANHHELELRVTRALRLELVRLSETLSS